VREDGVVAEVAELPVDQVVCVVIPPAPKQS
jgi:hypothetical protein